MIAYGKFGGKQSELKGVGKKRIRTLSFYTLYIRVRSFGSSGSGNNCPRSLGFWWIKGPDDSTLIKDLSPFNAPRYK